MIEFDYPEVTLYGRQNIKIQLLISISSPTNPHQNKLDSKLNML